MFSCCLSDSSLKGMLAQQDFVSFSSSSMKTLLIHTGKSDQYLMPTGNDRAYR